MPPQLMGNPTSQFDFNHWCKLFQKIENKLLLKQRLKKRGTESYGACTTCYMMHPSNHLFL